jgi:hypothetical protein
LYIQNLRLKKAKKKTNKMRTRMKTNEVLKNVEVAYLRNEGRKKPNRRQKPVLICEWNFRLRARFDIFSPASGLIH